MSDSDSRFERQAGLVPRERLSELTVSIIGVGAIGRQVALQLASLGVAKLQLVDFDRVEATNITTQGYLQADLGMSKVVATAAAIGSIDSSINVELIEDRYRPQIVLGEAVFCCVDSISARAAIWRSAGSRCKFWCDGRMLSEVMRILTVAEDHGRSHYPTTLFQQAEAETGTCTARCDLHRRHRGWADAAPVLSLAATAADRCGLVAESAGERTGRQLAGSSPRKHVFQLFMPRRALRTARFFRFLTLGVFNMSQYDLDSAVAEATGESLRTIRRRGFSIVQPQLVNFDPEPDLLAAQMIDWDQLDEQRRAA